MKYSAEMVSGGMIYLYIPNFMKISSSSEKSKRENSQTHRQHRDRISIL
jgi:hypothetical protein